MADPKYTALEGDEARDQRLTEYLSKHSCVLMREVCVALHWTDVLAKRHLRRLQHRGVAKAEVTKNNIRVWSLV